MVRDRPFVSAKPLGLDVVRKCLSLLAEFSGAQTRFGQTMSALVLKSAPRLSPAEWADQALTQPMRFHNLPLVLSVQHAGGV